MPALKKKSECSITHGNKIISVPHPMATSACKETRQLHQLSSADVAGNLLSSTIIQWMISKRLMAMLIQMIVVLKKELRKQWKRESIILIMVKIVVQSTPVD